MDARARRSIFLDGVILISDRARLGAGGWAAAGGVRHVNGVHETFSRSPYLYDVYL